MPPPPLGPTYKRASELFAAGDLKGAEAVLSELARLHPRHFRSHVLLGRVLEKHGDLAGAEEHYRGMCVRFPQQPGPVIRLAIVRSRQGAYAEALQFARRVLEKHPTSIPALNVAAGACYEAGDAEQALHYYEALLGLDPDNPARTSELIRLLERSGNAERAQELFRRAINLFDDATEIYALSGLFTLSADLHAKCLAWAEAVGENATPRARAVATGILVRLKRANGSALLTTDQTRVAELLGSAPADSQLKRSIVEDTLDEVIVARSEQPSAMILVFTGLADGTMMPITVLDRYLAALNATAIYLRDRSRLLFNNGIASVADDFLGTCRSLQHMATRPSGVPLVTIGSSAGGYGALRYGLELRADVALAFSGPTNLSANFLDGDGRGRIVARRLQSLPPAALDIRPLIRGAGGRTQIHLFYGEDMPQDARHAQHVAGEPGVALHPLPEVKMHAVLPLLASRGKLMSILRRHLLGQAS